MKSSKTILLFALACASGAFADAVSPATARFAAGTWALSDAALGASHGKAAGVPVQYDVDGSAGFYAVPLEGGGMLFLAADDSIDPVLGFTSSSSPDLSEEGPLLNLLSRDIAARRKMLDLESASGSTVSYAATPSGAVQYGASAKSAASSGRAKKLWAALAPAAAQGTVSDGSGLVKYGATADPRATSAISDIRVEPILASQWSQETADGGLCYNYYTPNNYPCGCVATAAGQILYRWRWPEGPLASFSHACEVDGEEQTLDSTTPREYDWDAMVPRPDDTGIDLAGRQAIGALLYDLGLSFGAEYTRSGTGATENHVAGPLRAYFGFASAYTYSVNGTGEYASSLHEAPARQRAILANLDAKRPVELYILSTRAGGHAVVADGYGYVTIGDEETEFTHINMGWAGTDDMWYNLPVIKTQIAGAQAGQTGGYEFEYLMGATFNIHPTETGDLLTGRVVDDGDPVEGATVTASDSATGAVLATTVSDAHGVYSFCLPGGVRYDVMAVSADGKKSGTLEDVFLAKTSISNTATYMDSDDSCIGNSWGNDIDIVIPYARIGDTLYPNLNKAIEAATAMEEENPVITVFGPVAIKKPVTITADMTIVTVPVADSDYPEIEDCAVQATAASVTTAGWSIQVADGVRVSFSNFVANAVAGGVPAIDVLQGGSVAFQGVAGPGRVATADEEAFILSGPVQSAGPGLLVVYPGATTRRSRFGSYECSYDEIAPSAGIVQSGLDGLLTGLALEDGTLVWERDSVDESIALAKATDADGTTLYRSFDVLFQDYPKGAEITVYKGCAADMFSSSVLMTNDYTMASATGAPLTVELGASASIAVSGAKLSVSNIVFTRARGASAVDLATVDGGGALELGAGAGIAGLSLAGTARAVTVKNGTVSMAEGSSIKDCAGTNQHKGTGAGIGLLGNGCTLEISGGTVSGCSAGSNAGGVYAAKGSKVRVSGAAVIDGNTYGSKGAKGDLYLANNGILEVAGELSGKIGVNCASGGSAAGAKFAAAGEGLAEEAAESSCGALVNIAKTGLKAEYAASGAYFRWVARESGPFDVPATEADVAVETDGVTKYWTIEDAFLVATNAEQTVRLVRDVTLTNNLAVASGATVLLDGAGFALTRGEGDFRIAVTNASLSVTNIVLNGGTGYGRLLDAKDSSLALLDGAAVEDVSGTDSAMVAAVVVWGGTFTMESGSAVRGCVNGYARPVGGALAAGGVVVTGSAGGETVAYMNGGKIENCIGSGAGGMYVGNGARVETKGDATVRGNKSLSGADSNIVVQDLSGLVLAGELSGVVGYTEGVNGDTEAFGRVAADLVPSASFEDDPEAWSNLVVYAHRFRHDTDGSLGLPAARRGDPSDVILVWKNALDGATEYAKADDAAEGGEAIYDVIDMEVDDDPVAIPCVPFTFVSIEETAEGKWRLVLKPGVAGCTYTLYSSGDLSVPLAAWTREGAPKTLTDADLTDDLEFEFVADPDGEAKFWYVAGEDGEE